MNQYRIICLKRSGLLDMNRFDYLSDWFMESDIVYWMPNRQGYTRNVVEAGLYSASDLELCAGNGLDWMIIRVREQ